MTSGELGPNAARCTAHRKDGGQCKRSPIRGSTVCPTHGGSAPQVRRKAQERILASSDLAAANLIQWMGNDKVPWPQRVDAAKDLLNRANVSGKQQVELTMPRYESLMDSGELVVDVGVEDAEVVPDYSAELEELI